MFRGLSTINMDGKGRLAIPAKYRDKLTDSCAGQLVVTIDTADRCLWIYPLPVWETIQAQLEALPNVNPQVQRMQRLLIGHASDVDMDGNGRLLLPTTLRDYASLEKKLVLVGMGKKFELWSEVLWQERRTEWLADQGDAPVPQALLDLSL